MTCSPAVLALALLSMTVATDTNTQAPVCESRETCGADIAADGPMSPAAAAAAAASRNALKPIATLRALENLHTPARVPVTFDDILNKQSPWTLIYLVRRLGCGLCRAYVAELSRVKPEFDGMGVKMVAMSQDRLSQQEFEELGVWKGELYFDDSSERPSPTFVTLGAMRGSVLQAFRPSFWKNMGTLRKKQKEVFSTNNFKGDGFQMGGTFLIHRDIGVVWQHVQKVIADDPDVEVVVEKVRETISNLS